MVEEITKNKSVLNNGITSFAYLVRRWLSTGGAEDNNKKCWCLFVTCECGRNFIGAGSGGDKAEKLSCGIFRWRARQSIRASR